MQPLQESPPDCAFAEPVILCKIGNLCQRSVQSWRPDLPGADTIGRWKKKLDLGRWYDVGG
jgi:hypothetical protein